jgi:hypothetical protein
MQKLGRIAPRECERMFSVIARSALCPPKPAFGRRRMRRSNPPFPCGAMDCFAHRAARSADPLARNDGGGVTPTVMPERPEEANPES